MVFIYLILFFAISVFALFDKNKDRYVTNIYIGLIAAFTFIAGFRAYDCDRDIATYLHYYYNSSSISVEYTFLAIVALAKETFNTPRTLFVAYALLSVPLKGYALTRLTNLWFLSFLVWLSHYFMLHDMTQIRVSVSMAIFLFALPYLLRGEKLKYIGCVLLAVTFHVSTLALLPLVLFGNKDLGRIWKVTLYVVPVVCILMLGLKINLLNLLPIPYVQDRISGYQDMRENGLLADDLSFSMLYFLKITIYVFMLIKYEVIKEKTENFSLFLKFYAFSFLCFSLFGFLPVLAWRVREMYAVIEIIIIPYLAYSVKPLNVGKILVILFATVQCCAYMFEKQLIR